MTGSIIDIARGDILKATGRIAEALSAMENALTVDPNNLRARTGRDLLRTQLNSGNSGNGGGGN